MREDIIEILCEINPLLDPEDEDMSIAEFFGIKATYGIDCDTGR